jgi:hypothetical protein
MNGKDQLLVTYESGQALEITGSNLQDFVKTTD